VTARRLAWAAAALLALGSSCGGEERSPASPSPIRSIVPNLERYPITAIDYHFHDAHPTAALPPDGVILVRNEGRNLHNATIDGTDYSRDVRPGEELRIDTAEVFTEPGRYRLVCKYHLDRRMIGTIVIEG
jgi:hypothetical protein